MIALLLALFTHPAPEAVVTPEAMVITPGFDAVWVPEGVSGPIVAAPFTAEVFEVSGE
jgi:hypothetical protein